MGEGGKHPRRRFACPGGLPGRPISTPIPDRSVRVAVGAVRLSWRFSRPNRSWQADQGFGIKLLVTMVMNPALVAGQFAANERLERSLDLATGQNHLKPSLPCGLPGRSAHPSGDQHLTI